MKSGAKTDDQNHQFGKLKKLNVRKIWPNEAADFTPWLAQETNLHLLGETIGLELELEAQEKDVGPFRADILCKDVTTNNWILIKNQLEKTNHTHLGQILTYAAGLNAVTIIWIAKHFTEEHRAALDWLNNITDTSVNFFGLEIEVWQIGDSLPAPKFNIVSKPNDWTKTVAEAAGRDLTDNKAIQLKFWTAFKAFVNRQNSKFLFLDIFGQASLHLFQLRFHPLDLLCGVCGLYCDAQHEY